MENIQSIESAHIPIRILYHQLLELWNQRNAEAMADLMTDDANVVGFDGIQINKKPEIARILRQIFIQHKTSTYVSIVREIRFLSDSVAILRAVAGLIPRGRSDINPASNGVQTMIAQKVGEEWKISLFQNTPAAYHGRPEMTLELSQELSAAISKSREMADK